jgi:hypothetical protein
MVGMQVTIYNPALDEPDAPLAERIVELLGAGLGAPRDRVQRAAV